MVHLSHIVSAFAVLSVAHVGVHALFTEKVLGEAFVLNDFSFAVGIDGTLAAISSSAFAWAAPGFVHLYRESSFGSGEWSFEDTLAPTDGVNQDIFGGALDVNELCVGVGAAGQTYYTGAVYVYCETSAGAADHSLNLQKIVPGIAVGLDQYGASLRMNGDYMFVGAPGDSEFGHFAGCVYIYTNIGGVYQNEVEVHPADSAGGYNFGSWLSVDGPTALVAATGMNVDAGGVYIYQENGGNWEAQVTFIAPPAEIGSADYFGSGLDVDSTNVAIAASSQEFSSGVDSTGVVFFYYETSLGAADWLLNDIFRLEASDTAHNLHFGGDIQLRGSTVMIGARGNSEFGTFSGALYIYSETVPGDHIWTNEIKYTPDDGQTQDIFAARLAWKDDNAAIVSISGGGDYGAFAIVKPACLSSPCANGGTCADTLFEFTCTCPSGYTGDFCNVDVDDCASSPCENGGTCSDTGANSFACDCTDTGFMGEACDNNIDDCASSPCNAGVCTDAGIKMFTCDCTESGFVGTLCDVEEDECLSSPCEHGAPCTDLGVKAFACDCTDTGYEGHTCSTNIDDCASSPCSNDGVCYDDLNTFSCKCTSGYTGIDCSTNIDDCASSPCVNGVCSDDVDAFTCDCDEGYEGDVCDSDMDDCASSPCLNGGMCSDAGSNRFVCDCDGIGFEGKLCNIRIDACVSSPCLHDGVCVDVGPNEFQCDCASTGYHGETCVTPVDECTSSPCLNGATCVDQVLDYECTCIDGFTGVICSEDVDDCLSSPCDGNCTDMGLNLYQCSTSTVVIIDPTPGQGSGVPVIIILTFDDVDNADTLAVQLRTEILPAALHGEASDFDVIVQPVDDGSYQVTIYYANEENYSDEDIQTVIATNPELVDSTSGMRVSVYGEEAVQSHAVSVHCIWETTVFLIVIAMMAF